MYRYSAFCLSIDSELELPEFAPGNGKPDVVIRLATVTPEDKRATIRNEIALPQDIGRFHIRNGSEIIVDPLPNSDPGVIRNILQGRLMAYLLRQRGWLPLHASSVACNGQGVLFLGASGAGKSTTAAAFYARGHTVLTDDVAPVRLAAEGVELQTSWSGLRLLDDSTRLIGHRVAASGFQGDKYIFRMGRRESAAPVPVKRIYFLEHAATGDHSPVTASVLPASSAAALLNAHSFLRSWRADRELQSINLDRAGSISARIPVHRLTRSQSLDHLPGLVDYVERDLADHG
jgi:hypothetical protein